MSSISTRTSQVTRNIVNVHHVNRVVNVEKLDIQKEIVTTNLIHVEQVNIVYNLQRRTIYQPVNNLGNVINITA